MVGNVEEIVSVVNIVQKLYLYCLPCLHWAKASKWVCFTKLSKHTHRSQEYIGPHKSTCIIEAMQYYIPLLFFNTSSAEPCISTSQKIICSIFTTTNSSHHHTSRHALFTSEHECKNQPWLATDNAKARTDMVQSAASGFPYCRY